MSVSEKACTRCKVVKPIDQFSVDKRLTLGRASGCKACQKAWEMANKDAIVARRREFHKRNAERLRQNAREYAAAHPEQRKAAKAAWYEKNGEKEREYARQRYWANPAPSREAARKWSQTNRARATASHREWVKRAGKATFYRVSYDTRKKTALPFWANRFFIEEAYRLARLRQQVCGGTWHVDHIVPLQSPLVCGLHVEHNLQVIPGRLNSSKGNRWWPDMWEPQ